MFFHSKCKGLASCPLFQVISLCLCTPVRLNSINDFEGASRSIKLISMNHISIEDIARACQRRRFESRVTRRHVTVASLHTGTGTAHLQRRPCIADARLIIHHFLSSLAWIHNLS